MSQRMKKEDILKVLSELKVSPEEFWVVSSGALVLRGIFPDAGDIDLAVTDRGLEELKENYSLKPKGNGWYQVSDCIECVCDGKKENLPYQPEKIGEYYVQNIEEYEAYLKTSTREKDQKRIPIVRAYIQKRKGK